MTSRQARKQRRAEERAARKAEQKLDRAPGFVSQPLPPVSPELLEEFGPELIAEPRAARARVHRRIEANRENAQHSTGPITPEGKAICSRNALKHGLASGALIIAGEDPAEFEALRKTLLEEHAPTDETEKLLVIKMAQSWWLSQRALRLQEQCFTSDGDVDTKRLSLMLRYQSTHDRQFFKSLSELRALRKARLQQARVGSVSQTARSSRPDIGSISQPSTQTGISRLEPLGESLEAVTNSRPGAVNEAPGVVGTSDSVSQIATIPARTRGSDSQVEDLLAFFSQDLGTPIAA
jgi:hypothetical protein